MKKLILLLLAIIAFASIKEKIQETKTVISKMNDKLDRLAKEISKKEDSLVKLNRQIKELNAEILQLESELKNSNKTLTELNDLKKGYSKKKVKISEEIDNFLSTNYYLDSQKIENINDLIQNELTNEVLKVYSKKIQSLIKENKNIEENILQTNKKITYIMQKKAQLKEKKANLLKLLTKQKNEIKNLQKEKANYKKRLYALIQRQKNLQKKLQELKVLKIKKVKVYNAHYKLKTATYKGKKTIAPVAGKVIKKFGSYIDPVYKIRIYNDSITIKPYQKNATIRSIMPGKVVYIGENNGKKIVVIKHKNKIFSIYANLDKISPILKKGKYVKRGQIIARVKDTLEFEVTYKDRPINPLKVVKF
ncbi:MAG: peptidoglycan DD-metalloendopeptidase family protein [Epsilonproteobacteria bacterium]|nr:peptidoglycan DD-metalloendopeptidase family protein [Campylobacterota bacterium]